MAGSTSRWRRALIRSRSWRRRCFGWLSRSPASLLDLLEADEHGFHRAVQQTLPPGSELVLVIDQLEEIFTLVEDEAERRRFLDCVRVAVTVPDSCLRIVSTLRADFFDRPLAYRGFAELVRSRTEPIVPLAPQELERAISGPAENVGVAIEPALVAQVVADVAEHPGALPLMQYALTELFANRSDGVLSAEAYREIGGVSGALARRAEQLYGATNAAGQQATEQLFLRLVALGEGTEDTRRRVSRSELDRMGVDGRALDSVIEAFARHRLFSLDRDPETREPTVEVAHEALLREWIRLRGWIDAARDDLRTERRLASAVAEWDAGGRDPSFLLRGNRLEQLSTWASGTHLALAQAERDYLDQSGELAEAERSAEQERVQREARLERRSVRRLRTAVAVFAIAAVVAGSLTLIATDQSQRAEAEARAASARVLAASAVANLEADQQLSVLLAIEAVQLTRSVDGTVLREAEEALHRAVTASRIVKSIPGSSELGPNSAFIEAIDWGPGGLFVMEGTFASEGPRPDGTIDLRDEETGEIVRSFLGHDGELTGSAFSPDGSMLATTGADHLLKVWDLSSDVAIETVPGPSQARSPSFSADGSRVAAAFGPANNDAFGVVKVLDLDSGKVDTFPAPPYVNDVALSPDGRRLAVVGGDWREDSDNIHVVDIETAVVHRIPDPESAGLLSVAWSPDGRYIAAGGWLDDVPVWDAAGELQFLVPHGAYWVDWSPDSTRLLTGGPDATARIWGITEVGEMQTQTLSAMSGEITGLTFSPDGTRVMTRSENMVLDVWDVGPGGDAEIANIADAGEIVSFSSAGRVTTSGEDGSLTSLDLASGEQTHDEIGWFKPPRGELHRLRLLPEPDSDRGG